MEIIEFTDRYKAMGIPYPEPKTMCKGQCEGTGWIPVYVPVVSRGGLQMEPEADPALIAAWREAEEKSPTADGWHFVKCPTCGGTGKAKA